MILLISACILYFTFLTPQFVAEPNLSNNIQTTTLKVDTKVRTFDWYAPRQINQINTIIYVLHGSTSSGPDIRLATAYEFDKIADEEGLIIVYPTGFENHWNDCRGSADYSANIQNIDDYSFFQEIENHITTQLNTNIEHRFATGHSNGAHLCYKFALEHPQWIDAIAPISANLPVDDNLDCSKSNIFVPICLINGTADKVNPYDGGLVEILGNSSRGAVLSTEQTLAYWTQLSDCMSPQVEMMEDKVSDDNSTIRKSMWSCDSTIQVINYEVINGGHVIPHPDSKMPKILGTTNQDINAPRAIWSFFKMIKAKA